MPNGDTPRNQRKPRKVESRHVVFHPDLPEALQIEIADRVARSLNPAGDPAGDMILEQICLQFDAGNMEIYDRPALDAFVKRWGTDKFGTAPDVREE